MKLAAMLRKMADEIEAAESDGHAQSNPAVLGVVIGYSDEDGVAGTRYDLPGVEPALHRVMANHVAATAAASWSLHVAQDAQKALMSQLPGLPRGKQKKIILA